MTIISNVFGLAAAADNGAKRQERERVHTSVRVALKFHHDPNDEMKVEQRVVLWLDKIKTGHFKV